MEEKRRGFTLIELLAVIVILAIIALIATPIVLNLINTARKGAFARSAEGVLKASKLYYTSSLVEDITPIEITFKCNNIECISSEKSIKLDVDGNMGTGNVTITGDGKVFFELGNGTYCAEKKQDSNDIKVSKKICGELVINKPSDLKITYKTEKAGEITVVGSVSNDDAEIKSYEFSIDNGATWEKATGKIYTFKNLEIGKEYNVLMRVTNLKNEQEQIELEHITTALINDIEYDISNQNEWSVSKTVTITGPEIDENIYKIIYSLDGIHYEDYIEPIKFTENSAIKVDIVKKEDNTSILNKIITINITGVDSTIPNLNVTVNGAQIKIEMNDEESKIKSFCVNTENDKSSCEFINTKISVVTYTLKKAGNYYVFAMDNAGNISEGFLITVERICEKGEYNNINSDKTYCSGSLIKNYGGYNWYVVSDDGENLTLLMAEGLKNADESYLKLNHCTNDRNASTDCGVYSWKWTNSSSGVTYNYTDLNYSWGKSLINNYLNNEFYNNLSEDIKNSLVTVKVCEDTTQKNNYGGYLQEEIVGLSGKCPKYVDNNVRLLTLSEYFSLNQNDYKLHSSYPYYNLTYINKNIDKLTEEDINIMLLDDSENAWHFMTKANNIDGNNVSTSTVGIYHNQLNVLESSIESKIRPVITIVK